jgi:hypothetical protein
VRTLSATLLVVAVMSPPPAAAGVIGSVHVGNGGRPFAGDRRLLTTISPNGDGLRDVARITFALAAPAAVRLDVETTRIHTKRVYSHVARLAAGRHVFVWAPAASTLPRTYLVRLTAADRGTRAVRASTTVRRADAVVRVQGIDAAFARASYGNGTAASLTVATDAATLGWQITDPARENEPPLRIGSLAVPTRDRPFRIRIPTAELATGVYVVRLESEDGRVGVAPFVVPPQPSRSRVAVVLPTSTWQAYNFEDVDGDGWGDTWYAGWYQRTARTDRHYMGLGLPQPFRRYELPYLRWLAGTDALVDYLSDDDLARMSAAQLARAYDLLIFPGHHEYVTDAEYRAVRGFRDRGGNLMLLAANNFYWQVRRHGAVIERVIRWRDIGRPEGALLGAQYVANDGGQHRAPWRVRHPAAARWLWAGTGLQAGSAFGSGGIEIDAAGSFSPRGTIVLADIRGLYGPPFSAEATYYETRRGARVFSAGAFMFADPDDPVVSRILENLWERLTHP